MRVRLVPQWKFWGRFPGTVAGRAAFCLGPVWLMWFLG